MLSVALGTCSDVDVYGAGMFSEGPSSDTLYQHYYDRAFARGCLEHQCVATTEVDAKDLEAMRAPERILLYKLQRTNESLCTPQTLCAPQRAESSMLALRQSEVPTEFFFLADLRLYVLHALGHINWVWY